MVLSGRKAGGTAALCRPEPTTTHPVPEIRMNQWAEGYVSDIDYAYAYFPELNPLNMRLAFLNAGLEYPELGAACELGFGQGMSLNLHAAATTVAWHGTDFNASQASFARNLAAISGSGAKVRDDSFAEFAHNPDLPDFDFVGLHGVWSWISDENRAVIVDFLRRKLKLGGVVYISYNTLPAWGPVMPLRQLMTQHTRVFGAEGQGTAGRIDQALEFVDRLVAADPAYFRVNPQLVERFEEMKTQSRLYLAHEYFNRDWQPIDFPSMAGWLDGAKLSYACPASYMDHLIARTLAPAQQALLNDIHDPVFREGVYDFIVNRQFRKDYWIKGPRSLSSPERMERLRSLRVMLQPQPLPVPSVMGYENILEILAENRPMSLGQLEQALAPKGVHFGLILQAAIYLSGSGHLAAVQDEASVAQASKRVQKLNAHLLGLARYSDSIGQLANPTTGGGVEVDHVQKLFLLQLGQGGQQPAELAQFAWQTLQALGRPVLKAGAPLAGAEESLAELTERAARFLAEQLPLLQALHVV